MKKFFSYICTHKVFFQEDYCRGKYPGNLFLSGFTIVELVISIAIIGTLVAIAIPVLLEYVDRAKIIRAIGEVRTLETDISEFNLENQAYPNSLNVIGRGNLLDPWGNPYQYLQVAGTPQGQLRKDRFLVPVNSDYDLYSMGKDGQSQRPFTAAKARDDIVRANDGGYVGLASEF